MKMSIKLKSPRNAWNDASIQSKMMFAFFVPLIMILLINIYTYTSVNNMTNRIDETYVSNVTLNALSENLTNVQSSMREYLENKGSSALNDYYRYDQEYRNILSEVGSGETNSGMAIMEQNIINQSNRYLTLVDETIQAKRGRNVEKYRANYETLEVMYEDLKTCIYSLNNEQFKNNTDDYYELLSALKYMEMISIIILLVIGVVNIIVLFIVTRSMAKPLIDLSRAANEVAEGNFDVQLDDIEGNDEIGVVSGAFVQMAFRLKVYINEIRESMHRESEMKEHELVMESRMKEVQLRNLQAQINPHFLFNTLNAGAQLAMMEGADKTTDFIQNMADFFRYNIKKINMDASIEEEASLVDKYIYILNVRFTGEINYEAEVDPDVLNVRIPSMVLQPLVENAVNYGIRDISWDKHIWLKITKDDEKVYLSVKDNGVGMSPETIDKILSGHASELSEAHSSASNGVGLANVIERLQIFTGTEDVIDIISEGEGKGTEFIIKVPLHKGDLDV